MTIEQPQTPRRYRAVSGRPLNRRVVLQASAGVGAIAAMGGIGTTVTPTPVAAQERVTRAETFAPPDNEILGIGEWHGFGAAYPFYALGASWDAGVGTWPVVEVQLGDDGVAWSETFRLAADNDGGQPTRGDRTFTPLIHSQGAAFVRWRTIDGDGTPGVVSGLEFTYIDATDGPWEDDLAGILATESTFAIGASNTDFRTPPEIITRAQWGANETYRFASFGEIWPPEYEPVTHIIIHHTATPNSQDIPTAIRSIYYYHAVSQGWGDIGYNYLVGRDGRIYEGRHGGQNAIGGHSFQFAIGSSGIGVVGDFQRAELPFAGLSGLVAITAWVGRDLDPYARQTLQQAPNLPVISSHRDVNATTCPGDLLYADLPEIRDLVAAALDDLDTPFPGGIVPGDRVRVQTPDGSGLNVRSAPRTDATRVGSLANRSYAIVTDGPSETTSGNWYAIDQDATGISGWVTAAYVIVTPLEPVVNPGDLRFGTNLVLTQSANMRSLPSTGAGVVTTLATGSLAFVLDGPETADGFTWYWVQNAARQDGWVASQFLSVAPFDPSPNGAFDVGDTTVATQSVTVRARPGLAQTGIATIPQGQRITISQAPVGVNGEIWYGVYRAGSGGGWATERSMRVTDPGPTPPFVVGDRVRVTEATNLRQSPATTGALLGTMPAGTTADVIGGPQTGGGYTWWQLRTAGGTGWAVGTWLQKDTDIIGALIALLQRILQDILNR